MTALVVGVPTPKVRVLVAEGPEILARTLAAILDLAGYEACALYWGEAAQRLLNLLNPELVITNVSDPNPAVSEGSASALPVPPLLCKILLFTGHVELHNLFGEPGMLDPPFELVTRPIRAEDLLMKLRESFCSAKPPVLLPIDMTDTRIH